MPANAGGEEEWWDKLACGCHSIGCQCGTYGRTYGARRAVGAHLVHLSECFKPVYRKGQRLWRTA